MNRGELGCIITPAQGNLLPEDTLFAADNGCFGRGYPGDVRWIQWLARYAHLAARCLFAVAPDVVGDAKASTARSLPWLPVIRAMGFRVAYAAQDGLESMSPPWDEFDVLFIGGSTGWKLSAPAAAIAREAKARGKGLHMGRVNSARRWGYAEYIGCDSVDGTFLAFGPDINLRRLRRWTGQPGLFESEAS